LLQAAKLESDSFKYCPNKIASGVLGGKSHERTRRTAASRAAFTHQERKKQQPVGTRRCRSGCRRKRGQGFARRKHVAEPLQALAPCMK